MNEEQYELPLPTPTQPKAPEEGEPERAECDFAPKPIEMQVCIGACDVCPQCRT